MPHSSALRLGRRNARGEAERTGIAEEDGGGGLSPAAPGGIPSAISDHGEKGQGREREGKELDKYGREITAVEKG